MASKKKIAKAKTKKPTLRKATRTTTGKTTTTTAETKPVNKVAKAVKKPRSKSDIVNVLAETTGLTKKEVGRIFDSLSQLITFDIGNAGPGVFNIPGLMKILRVHKPATKARKGVNPFTGEPMLFKAKPARDVVKVRALKALKEMVG